MNKIKSIVYCLARKNSYSQNGEDLILIDYFNENPNGFYVDIGCHHPFRFSNTYLLYKKGWRGLNVDANKWTISLFNFLEKETQIKYQLSAILGRLSIIMNFMKQLLVVY